MILVTGGTGFVGREIVACARAAGFTVRVVCRNPERGRALWGNDKGVEIFHGNVLNPESLVGAFDGIEAVLHLVGIICESRENTFDRVHRVGTINVVEAMKKAKIKRHLHMSALGARADARSQYHKSKWAAEEWVRASGLEFTIFRPSVIYGPSDKSINLFARMTRFLPVLPVIGSGNARWQPVSVEQVGQCFVRAVREPLAVGKTYDLVGLAPIPFEEVLDTVMAVTRRRPKIHIPIPVARAQAWVMEHCLDNPPLNSDQILMLEEDNIGDATAAVSDLGLKRMPLAEDLRRYLKSR